MTRFGPLCTAFHLADQRDADPQEIDWYATRLPRDAGPVLDAMCGLGRVLVPLSERGFSVHGVDASGPMLAECETRLAANGSVPKLYRQEMAQLNLPFRYAAAYIAGSSLLLIADRDIARSALERIRAHLVAPAILLLDMHIPEEALHAPAAPLVEFCAVRLADGSRIMLRSETRVDTHARTIDRNLRFEKRSASGSITREDEIRASTWYDADGIRALLAESGYADVVIVPPATNDRGETAFGVTARAA
ncbi:MAG TPA: class I SAM-dependent methyltransferase [Casimicrobiaceae bacterium]|nr:class I SAM-dependent methyltransferase [Casimicrobiaceae bacterium]